MFSIMSLFLDHRVLLQFISRGRYVLILSRSLSKGLLYITDSGNIVIGEIRYLSFNLNNVNTGTLTASASFDDFMGAIQKGEQLNSYNARQISNDEILNNRIYEQHNGVSDESRFRFSTLQKAYEPGLVDNTGVLTSSYRSKA